MAVVNYDDENPGVETGYDNGPGVGYAPDRARVVPPEGARSIATFSSAARGPRVPTSALTGTSFSAAPMTVDAQFAQAAEHSVAMRALGWGPAEHAGEHQILTAEGPSIPSGEELLDRVAPRWREASQAHQPEMPGFSRPVFNGRLGRRGGAAKDSGQAAEEPEAAKADEEIPNNTAGPRAF